MITYSKMGKKVLKIGLVFLLFGLVIIFTVSTILAFVAPAFMAKTFESLNMPSLAYGCYDRQYRNSTEVDQQYIMFTKAVEISYDTHVVYYGDKLFANKNYGILIVNINESNINKTEKYIQDNPQLSENEKTRLQILSRNEDNYIKNCYVRALMTLDKQDKARDFLLGQINEIIKKEQFGKETSFAVQGYIEKTKTLPENLKNAVLELLNKFEESLTYDEENITLENKICFQRLTEIANCLSTHYRNSGDAEKSNTFLQKAQNYLNLIYS